MGIVQDQQSHTIEDIIDIMIGRGSTVTKAEALSVIEEYEAAIEQILAGGGSVNTSLFRTKDSIAGVLPISSIPLIRPAIIFAGI